MHKKYTAILLLICALALTSYGLVLAENDKVFVLVIAANAKKGTVTLMTTDGKLHDLQVAKGLQTKLQPGRACALEIDDEEEVVTAIHKPKRQDVQQDKIRDPSMTDVAKARQRTQR